MKKNLLLLFVFSLSIASCLPSKNISEIDKLDTEAERIVAYARTFIGTKYKYGGTSKNGMDCSGLVFTAFKKENIQLPRVSRDMAKSTTKISIKNIKVGDLVFFKTSNSRRINHVGVVSYVKNGIINFVHSTNSRGVIESTMVQKYWKNAFVKATKVLN